MGKSITFVDKDAQLIKKIVAYQKERGISSFVETVRQLCEKALKFSEITNRGGIRMKRLLHWCYAQLCFCRFVPALILRRN